MAHDPEEDGPSFSVLQSGRVLRRGWPKALPCLKCGRLRMAEHPGSRLHAHCSASGDAVPAPAPQDEPESEP
jgi:hypothetical protein